MAKWTYAVADGPSQVVAGTWQIEFIDGGPTLPKSLQTKDLKSWSEQKDRPELATFSGTTRYSITFEKTSGEADDWLLDLGQVCESARVLLNGVPIGTLLSRPFRVRLGEALQEGENRLEIEVTNLMSNRIVNMSHRRIDWCKYFFVYMTKQQPQKWDPLPSGLLGPVRLIPVRLIPSSSLKSDKQFN